MRRKLQLLNLALVVLVAATGWRLWQLHQTAQARQARLLSQAPAPAGSAADEPAVTPPAPVRPADYIEIAEHLLLFPDRNPTVVLAPVEEKELPPLPVAHGVMDLGAGPTVILSEKPGGPQRGYRVGERVGDFVLAEVQTTALVFDWEGRKIRRSLEELRPKEGAKPVAAAAQAPKPRAAPAKSEVLAPTSKGDPVGADIGGGIRACLPGDTSPHGTVSGGYRKLIAETPFGKTCRWEPVK